MRTVHTHTKNHPYLGQTFFPPDQAVYMVIKRNERYLHQCHFIKKKKNAHRIIKSLELEGAIKGHEA